MQWQVSQEQQRALELKAALQSKGTLGLRCLALAGAVFAAAACAGAACCCCAPPLFGAPAHDHQSSTKA